MFEFEKRVVTVEAKTSWHSAIKKVSLNNLSCVYIPQMKKKEWILLFEKCEYDLWVIAT